ncbi:LOW QUALITY PROTEIN: nuclear pore complex protein Nup107 [Nilaparvata lugens]|uniref:LOW QUALITY PROTEIN: nuclear pore complex protein Nup107 n=1 Tax=Nilaparvata lugens TaxID=108931 RepID=UPI00193DFAF8|nr:LOW QUALITY PROTEIN: nuclear pore complex protein Nup107 [Nilaparvata lugens]
MNDELLERSLRLLDETTRTPISHAFRAPRSTNNSPRLSGSFQPKTRSAHPRKSTVFDSSITLNPGELSRILDGIPDKTTTFKNVQGCDQLYRNFMESAFFLDNPGLSVQVLDTIADFVQNCSDLLALKNGAMNTNDPDIAWLESERNSWNLVLCLYQNRLYPPKDKEDAMDVAVKHSSEKEIVSSLYVVDNNVKESQLVVDWLEKIAADQLESSAAPRFGSLHGQNGGVGEHAASVAKRAQIAYSSSRHIVASLEPDAQLRQNRPLHDLDMEDEARLLQQVFTEIRCGRLEQAHSLCYHAGQPWRACTLEGWRLHHDPNLTRPAHLDKLPVEGNPNRDIWKLCAWRLADDVRATSVTRAVSGALCGHLPALVHFCSGSWEDLLWSYTRVMIDVRVEQEIRAYCQRRDRPYVEMPDAYWNNRLSMEEIFSFLEASSDAKVSDESARPERVVQKLLILNKIPELLKLMAEWIQRENCTPHFTRYLAHLVLILRRVGESQAGDVGDEILKAYVKVLVASDSDCEVIAYYVATLLPDDQVHIYAAYLESVGEGDSEQRLTCLKVAEAATSRSRPSLSRSCSISGDHTKIVKIKMNKVSDDNVNVKLLAETTADDLEKVSALDWVVFYPQQRAEALWQTNALIRSFLAKGKLEAARLAFQKIPVDSLELIATQNQLEPGMQADEFFINSLPVRVSAAVREYLCHKAYLDAQEGFADWFEQHHNARPAKPAKLGDSASFTEKVAHDHKMALYNKEMQRWKMAVAHQTKCVKAQLYNVLLFPDGGWLVDNELDDQLRQQQMKSLRSLCLPKIVLLLHTVLQSSGDFTECMRLADLVVSEQYELYRVYSKQQLAELLHKLSETSLSLLDNKKDPWGYTVSS